MGNSRTGRSEHSDRADTPRSPARRAARHSVCAHPEVLGGFQTWFYFHPELRDFRIWSDTLKFQDRVKYLLKGLYWCFGEKKKYWLWGSGCPSASGAVWQLLCRGNCCPPARCVPVPVARSSVQAVPQLLSSPAVLAASPVCRHEIG